MFTLNAKGRLLTIDEPVVMGIMNLTPDSFFSGSRVQVKDDVLRRAGQMISDGAFFLDLGGQSTRPGSETISAEEELKRVLPAVEAIHHHFPDVLISVDTFYASVAKASVDAGASMINDVSAGTLDPEMFPTLSSLGVPYVLMHMKGHPQTMQKNPMYENVVLEVFDFLNSKIDELTRLGVHDIIVDPGFGFGKTIQHNFTLLKSLDFFKQLGKPLLAGLSRKGTVYKTLDILPEEALNGTTVLNTMALLNGSSILRVHDVKEAAQAIRLFREYKK